MEKEITVDEMIEVLQSFHDSGYGHEVIGTAYSIDDAHSTWESTTYEINVTISELKEEDEEDYEMKED